MWESISWKFLRELSIECHKNNLVLSVDNPVPEDFTSHYDRAEQGRVVDYVIIMGYDEHYVGSEEAAFRSIPSMGGERNPGYHRRGSGRTRDQCSSILHKTVENRGRYLIQ